MIASGHGAWRAVRSRGRVAQAGRPRSCPGVLPRAPPSAARAAASCSSAGAAAERAQGRLRARQLCLATLALAARDLPRAEVDLGACRPVRVGERTEAVRRSLQAGEDRKLVRGRAGALDQRLQAGDLGGEVGGTLGLVQGLGDEREQSLRRIRATDAERRLDGVGPADPERFVVSPSTSRARCAPSPRRARVPARLRPPPARRRPRRRRGWRVAPRRRRGPSRRGARDSRGRRRGARAGRARASAVRR